MIGEVGSWVMSQLTHDRPLKRPMRSLDAALHSADCSKRTGDFTKIHVDAFTYELLPSKLV